MCFSFSLHHHGHKESPKSWENPKFEKKEHQNKVTLPISQDIPFFLFFFSFLPFLFRIMFTFFRCHFRGIKTNGKLESRRITSSPKFDGDLDLALLPDGSFHCGWLSTLYFPSLCLPNLFWAFCPKFVRIIFDLLKTFFDLTFQSKNVLEELNFWDNLLPFLAGLSSFERSSSW